MQMSGPLVFRVSNERCNANEMTVTVTPRWWLAPLVRVVRLCGHAAALGLRVLSWACGAEISLTLNVAERD